MGCDYTNACRNAIYERPLLAHSGSVGVVHVRPAGGAWVDADIAVARIPRGPLSRTQGPLWPPLNRRTSIRKGSVTESASATLDREEAMMPPDGTQTTGDANRAGRRSKTGTAWAASGQRPNRDTESCGDGRDESTPNVAGCQGDGLERCREVLQGVGNALLTQWTCACSARATALAIPEVETPRWRAASARDRPTWVTSWTARAPRTAAIRRRRMGFAATRSPTNPSRNRTCSVNETRIY